VIFHRGKIVSVINLRSLFKMRERGLSDLNKFIIISYKDLYFGIIADSISGITQKSISSITPPPSTVDLKVSTFISGIFPDGVVLLDAKKLITSPEIIIK
jgi:chemotaxis signal transduction protein